MNIFQIVKKVLDSEYDQIPAKNKVAAINKRHQVLSHAYLDLTDPNRAAPDYSDPITRFAYIYKYTTCHADIVYERIRSSSELKALFKGDGWLRVACIGGGPGSDFLGVLKYALKCRKARSIQCHLLDRDASWGDTWSDVAQLTDDNPFTLSTMFQELDVTAPATWKTQRKYESADLFTFIYFLSEVYRFRGAADPFFRHVVTSAKPGALFLFVDNNAPTFTGYIDSFGSAFGLEVIKANSENYQTNFDEQKDELEPYLSDLSDAPKIKTKIYWAVMRKL